MNIRLAQPSDCRQIGLLFKESIEAIASAHYTSEQIAVWVSEYDHMETWQKRIQNQFFLVAESSDQALTGMASLAETGYLDLLYVHKDFQRQGVASRLTSKLEDQAHSWDLSAIWTEASITAKPFFEKMGYRMSHSQQKQYKEMTFTNFLMRKLL